MPQIKFDPLKYGAVPVVKAASDVSPVAPRSTFDPMKFGATPASPAAVPQAAPGPDERTALQVMIDQMDAVPRGVVGIVTGIPKAIAGAGGMVVDTVTGNSKRAQENLGGMLKGAVQPFTTTARNAGALVLPNHINAAAPEENIQAGEGAGAQLGGLLLGKALTKTPASVTGLPAKTAQAVVTKGTQLVTGVHPNPVVAMTQALKPYAKNAQWEKAITSSLPEIKASEAALGRAIANVDDMLEATVIAKKRLRADFDAIKGPKGAQLVDGSPIADAIEKTISRKVQLENPAHAESIKELAGKYRKSFSVDELDDFLHTYNAELESYYSKYPAAKRTATAGNPETAALEAGARATRDTLYKALDDPRVGTSAREINQKYGKLINVEKELYRRKNVNARQAPESLTEQMGKLGAAFQGAKGVGKIVTLTDPMGGFADIGSAVAGRKMAQILKERNSTDYLIRKTFENFKQAPRPVNPGFRPTP